MSKLERLLNLTAALLDTGRPLTASELRHRIEGYPDNDVAFRRAFERDKDDLREMGIPISRVMVDGEDGQSVDAYRIRKDDYYLRDPGLTPEELAALHLAAAAVRMDGLQGMEALWKLGGAAGDAGPDVDDGGPEVHLPSDPHLVPLFGAIAERRVVRFRYQGEERALEPHRLDFRRGRWLLSGWDQVRDAERHFRLERIEGDPALGPAGGFERRPELGGDRDQPSWELGDEPPVQARLLVDADHVVWATRHLPDDVPRGAGGRISRLHPAGHEPGGVPLLRVQLPRARRAARAPGPADRAGGLARRGGGRLMARPGALDAVRRVLAIVPWVAAQDGPRIDDVCERFGISRRQLLADLDVLPFVGLYPYTPDQLVEVAVEDERVWIRYAEMFQRPLRLTPDQALALVAAGSTLAAVPGADPEGALARGLAKLRTVLGLDPDELVDVTLGAASEDVLRLLQEAARTRHAVEIEYYAHGRDERTIRTIEPGRVFADEGHWYVAAWCRRAEGERLFRVDGISGARALDEVFEPRQDLAELGVFSPRPDDPRVVLELARGARWVLEQYPVEDVEEGEADAVRVTLVVTARPWLERLLLRLGPDARVVRADAGLASAGAEAASRVLARYRREPSQATR